MSMQVSAGHEPPKKSSRKSFVMRQMEDGCTKRRDNRYAPDMKYGDHLRKVWRVVVWKKNTKDVFHVELVDSIMKESGKYRDTQLEG